MSKRAPKRLKLALLDDQIELSMVSLQRVPINQFVVRMETVPSIQVDQKIDFDINSLSIPLFDCVYQHQDIFRSQNLEMLHVPIMAKSPTK